MSARKGSATGNSRNTAEAVWLDDDEEEVLVVEERSKSKSKKRAASASSITTTTKNQAIVILDDSPEKKVKRASPQIAKQKNEVKDKNEDLAAHLTCVICMELLYRPISLVPCAHMFCGGCFSQWDNLSCPTCREKVRMVIDGPKNIENMVDDFLVKCPKFKRSLESLNELDQQDQIPRGVTLSRRQQHVPAATGFQPAFANVPMTI
jgi:hypothetical protein